TGLARLHQLSVPDTAYPKLYDYLSGTVEPRVLQRLRRYGSELPRRCVDLGLAAVPAPTAASKVLLHADLYAENILFDQVGKPVFLDPLPIVGDVAFDWAFFIVYYDHAADPVTRLRAASKASGLGVSALLPWCLRLGLDGLLYYHDTADLRESRMIEVIMLLAAEGEAQ
ncbi:MAG: phosphotransferase, partial [Mycobacteriales bacterium]